MFEPRDFIQDPVLYGALVREWTETCEQFGKVTLVKPIEASADGVVAVRFDSAQVAALAIGEIDGGEPWDGTDLAVRESREDEEQRILSYERFLDGGVPL